MKNEVIKAFRVEIDLSKLQLQKFALGIYLADYSKKKSILDYFMNKQYMEYIDIGVGWADIQIEVIVENIEKLMKIGNDIDKKFPGTIRKKGFFVFKEIHKSRWLPEMEFK